MNMYGIGLAEHFEQKDKGILFERRNIKENIFNMIYQTLSKANGEI